MRLIKLLLPFRKRKLPRRARPIAMRPFEQLAFHDNYDPVRERFESECG